MPKRGKRGGSERGGKDALVRLCVREDWICWICGEEVPLHFKEGAPDAPSRDHFVPKVRLKKMGNQGEAFNRSNIRLAHRFCNSHRGDKAVADHERHAYRKRLREAVEAEAEEDQARALLAAEKLEELPSKLNRVRIISLDPKRRQEGIEEAARISKR